jgi:glutamine cyclotransferase
MCNITYLFVGIILFLSCKGGANPKEKESGKETVAAAEATGAANPKIIRSIQIISPTKWDTCRFNQEIILCYTNNKRFPVDSAQLFFNGLHITTLDSVTREFTLKLPEDKCGNNTLKVIAFHPNNRQGSATQSFIIKPDTSPRRLRYELVNTYYHDPDASTQGLVFQDGYMYEGTGIRGKSSLRKTDLANNKLLEMLSLESSLFGEGITIYQDKIYQITWTSRKGFVYNINTFELENTFEYATQGWGITTMNERLIMSDGTHQLYHLNPTGFNKIKTIEVYDHRGPVEHLNELEYIDGYIWANVWLTNRIVVIHPETGRVVKELYLPNMLTPAEKAKIDLKEDVLNGIAYHPEKNTVFVTGKHWPKIFELEIQQ